MQFPSLDTYCSSFMVSRKCSLYYCRRFGSHIDDGDSNDLRNSNTNTVPLIRNRVLFTEAWIKQLFISMGRDYVSELLPQKDLLFNPQMIHEYGEPRWKEIDGRKEKLGEKPVAVPLCPPQITNRLIQARTRASAVWSRWLNHLSYCTVKTVVGVSYFR
jgi:hypothetical protein